MERDAMDGTRVHCDNRSRLLDAHPAASASVSISEGATTDYSNSILDPCILGDCLLRDLAIQRRPFHRPAWRLVRSFRPVVRPAILADIL